MKASIRLASLPLAILVALAIAAPVAAGPGWGDPDGQVRRAGGPRLGHDIFNLDGTGQTVGGHKARRYKAGAVRWFYVYVDNTGPATDTFKMGATETESTTTVKPTGREADPFKVQYFTSGGTDITASVGDGSFRTPLVSLNGRYAIRVKVTVTQEATHGSQLDLLVIITSGSSTDQDAVRIRMRRK